MPVNPNQRTARSRTRQSCRAPRAIAALGARRLRRHRRQSRGKPASAGTGHNKAAAACAIEKPLRQAAS
ncbi:hypothetical protein AQ861_20475 [Burkholderia pseudomallei]|nr:hypothetical protein AQ861_20475 [Burkholderia pseudomallei]